MARRDGQRYDVTAHANTPDGPRAVTVTVHATSMVDAVTQAQAVHDQHLGKHHHVVSVDESHRSS